MSGKHAGAASAVARRWTAAAIGTGIVAMVVLVGAWGWLTVTPRPERSASAGPVTTLATTATTSPVPSPATMPDPAPAATMPSPTATPRCQDNVVGFLAAVRKVDPDGDELGGLGDDDLVRLGHAVLANPAVLERTRLVPFQYPRFVGAANQWLCH